MRIGSLFSGYGGLDLGVQAVLGGEVVWHVEYDKAPSRILDHHWPDVPNYGDVTAVDFTTVEPVDVLTGGYPCQPFSHAGMRKGTNDDRHLWPHVLRALREMGPRLAILENVRGHLTLGFDVVLADLADLGWSAEWGVVRASDAGAPHQRARLFILAYPSGNGRDQGWPESAGIVRGPDAAQRGHISADANLAGLERPESAGGHELPTGGTTADADFSGSQTWGDTGHDSKRLRAQPVGLAEPSSHPSGQRHGARQDGRGLGRLDSQDAAGSREWEWAREIAGDRGPANASNASHDGWDGRPGESDSVGGGHLGRLKRSDATIVGNGDGLAWGDYAPAIARWEHVSGRPAPAPTEPGRTGSPRLSPRFVEWMMGLPDGWVTDPAIGISRNDQLKALGNGVVPQQAALALSLLRDHVEAVAA